MHWDEFCQFSKSCHFCNIRWFLKYFFAQNDSNVLLQSFFRRFIELSFLNQFEHFAKAIARALWPIFPSWKSCHFSNIRCFLKPSFLHNNSYVLLESFFASVFRILIFDPNWLFCKGFSPPILPILKKLSFIRISGVSWSRLWHRTTLMCF